MSADFVRLEYEIAMKQAEDDPTGSMKIVPVYKEDFDLKQLKAEEHRLPLSTRQILNDTKYPPLQWSVMYRESSLRSLAVRLGHRHGKECRNNWKKGIKVCGDPQFWECDDVEVTFSSGGGASAMPAAN